MTNSFRLYLNYIKMTIVSQMEYKAAFIMTTVGNFALQIIEFIGIYALFARFGQIKGWTLYEVALFFGIINCAFAIAECVGRGYDVFHVHVKQGTFDRLLLRPRSLELQILGSEFQMMRFGRFLQGFVVFVFGLLGIEQTLPWWAYGLMILAVVSGALVFVGLLVLQAAMSFYTVESLEVMNAFTYGGVQTAQYPITIYKKWFQKIFLYVLPVGAIGYFPLAAILRGASVVPALLVPFLSVIFFAVATGVFRLGTRHYCSTGS